MKKTISFLSIIFAVSGALAQDIIFTNDGQTIEARNIRREGNILRYGLYASSIMDQSTYTIDLNRIRMIKYEDGHIFDPKAKEESVPVSMTKPTKSEPVAKTTKKESYDTVVAYAIIEPNKQLTPKTFNAYPPYKSQATAFVSSLAIAGLGQLYNDELDKGFLFMGGDLVFAGISTISFIKGNITAGAICAGAAVVFKLVAAVEAAIDAGEINAVHGYLSVIPSSNTMFLASDNAETGMIPCMGVSFAF